MKLLITGGNGFIGRYVQSRAKELGIETVIFDTSIDITHDVTDYNALSKFDSTFDAIIHLAGLLGTHELWDTAEDAIDVNIKGALNVGRLALEADAKLVSIEQPHIWYNVYEATKMAARRMLTGMHYDQGLRVDFVTAHNAFGPGQAYGEGHPQKIIPTFATKAWAGESIPIWGDGQQKVNLVYAGDVADKLLSRAVESRCKPLAQWHAGGWELITVSQVADRVNQIVRDGGGQPGSKGLLKMRKGEQNNTYPAPASGCDYPLKGWQLAATVNSYRSQTEQLFHF